MSGGVSLAQGIFERAKQIGIFLQLGELAAPAANAIDVQAAALAVHNTLNVSARSARSALIVVFRGFCRFCVDRLGRRFRDTGGES